MAPPARVALLRPPEALAGLFAETWGRGYMPTCTVSHACLHAHTHTSDRAHADGVGKHVTVKHLPRVGAQRRATAPPDTGSAGHAGEASPRQPHAGPSVRPRRRCTPVSSRKSQQAPILGCAKESGHCSGFGHTGVHWPLAGRGINFRVNSDPRGSLLTAPPTPPSQLCRRSGWAHSPATWWPH